MKTSVKYIQFSSVQLLSRVKLFATPWIAARQASLSITNSQSLPKPMSIKSMMPSSHLIICCPLLLLPPILPSIRVFFSESTLLMGWPKYWSFRLSISPSSEHPGLISFRMDWLDLLAVQGTLKSLLQHHSALLPSNLFGCLCINKVLWCRKRVKWLDSNAPVFAISLHGLFWSITEDNNCRGIISCPHVLWLPCSSYQLAVKTKMYVYVLNYLSGFIGYLWVSFWKMVCIKLVWIN